MTTEEKAKRFDEVVEEFRGLLEGVHEDKCDIMEEDILKIVPELKKSEDEKVKRMLHSISSKMSFHLCDIFTEEEFQCFDTWSNIWLEKQGKDKEINNFDVLPGLYKCVHRMFDGTPDGKLLFELGNIYKCLSKHDRAEFEVSYGHSIYLEDPVVCKHFIPFEKQGEQKQNPYTGTSFEYNGHTFGMCARDNGVEILMDGELKAFVSSEKSFVYPIHPQPDLAPKNAMEAIKEEKVDNANKLEPKDYSSIDPYFGKPIDKLEPKFNVGDWVVREYTKDIITINQVLDVKRINDEHFGYTLDDGTYFSGSWESSYHLWTIEDAKDGDVLATEDKNLAFPFVAIYKSLGDTVYGYITFNSRCFI